MPCGGRKKSEIMETVNTCKCPPAEVLQQLLVDALPSERQQECVHHIDVCEGCQAKLEEMATGGTNLSQVVERLNESQPMATSAYWPALKSLDSDSTGLPSLKNAGLKAPIVVVNPAATIDTPRRSPVARSRDLSLDFLQPASDNAYLGRLAQFDVMRLLGRGGMGIVLEAFDSRLQRNVAIKVLDPDFATTTFRGSGFAARPGPPLRSITKTWWPSIRSRRPRIIACPTWSCSW